MLTTVVGRRVYDFSHAVGRNTPTGIGFQYPIDLAVAEGGVVYVVSRSNELQWGNRVSKVSIGAPEEEELLCEFAKYGNADWQSLWPTSIALDREGNVYLADEWVQRISVFDADGKLPRQVGRARVSTRGTQPPLGHGLRFIGQPLYRRQRQQSSPGIREGRRLPVNLRRRGQWRGPARPALGNHH